MDAYYDPQFSLTIRMVSVLSVGCAAAFSATIRGVHGWIGTTWFIEGYISQYFDTLNHQVLMDPSCGKRSTITVFMRPHRVGFRSKAGYLEDSELTMPLQRHAARRRCEPTPREYLP